MRVYHMEFIRKMGRLWFVIAFFVMAAGVVLSVLYYSESKFFSGIAWGAQSSPSEKTAGDSVASLGFASTATASSTEESSLASASLETIPVEVVRRNVTLRLTGSMIADEESEVASNVSGIAAEIFVDRGSVVKKGQVLVQLDPTDAKNRLAEGMALVEELRVRLGLNKDEDSFNVEEQPEVKLAKSILNLATTNLNRNKKLFEEKVLSREAYDQNLAEQEAAQCKYLQSVQQVKQTYQCFKTALTRLVALRKAVDDTTIVAPFDGWVAEKNVSSGEQVSSGPQSKPVVTLVKINPLRVSLTVPQQNIGSVKAGQKVLFEVDSFPDKIFEGEVRFISPVVRDDTRSMVVEATVPNLEGQLRPGLFVTAELELPREKTDLFVPMNAVKKIGEAARVLVVQNDTVREQVVQLGQVIDNRVEIRTGLTGKERLVAKPDQVQEGAIVRK